MIHLHFVILFQQHTHKQEGTKEGPISQTLKLEVQLKIQTPIQKSVQLIQWLPTFLLQARSKKAHPQSPNILSGGSTHYKSAQFQWLNQSSGLYDNGWTEVPSCFNNKQTRKKKSNQFPKHLEWQFNWRYQKPIHNLFNQFSHISPCSTHTHTHTQVRRKEEKSKPKSQNIQSGS